MMKTDEISEQLGYFKIGNLNGGKWENIAFWAFVYLKA